MVRPNNKRPVSVHATRRLYDFGFFVLISVIFPLLNAKKSFIFVYCHKLAREIAFIMKKFYKTNHHNPSISETLITLLLSMARLSEIFNISINFTSLRTTSLKLSDIFTNKFGAPLFFLHNFKQ